MLIAVMEIDAIGAYTVSKTVYDLWMKVRMIMQLAAPTCAFAIGTWREHCKHLSYPVLYWYSSAGKGGVASSTLLLLLLLFIFRCMLVQLKLQ